MEKWLLEVQLAMIQSLKDVMIQSYEDYNNTEREKWVLNWPGQVCTDVCMYVYVHTYVSTITHCMHCHIRTYVCTIYYCTSCTVCT